MLFTSILQINFSQCDIFSKAQNELIQIHPDDFIRMPCRNYSCRLRNATKNVSINALVANLARVFCLSCLVLENTEGEVATTILF